jgi:hypothetical protein
LLETAERLACTWHVGQVESANRTAQPFVRKRLQSLRRKTPSAADPLHLSGVESSRGG